MQIWSVSFVWSQIAVFAALWWLFDAYVTSHVCMFMYICAYQQQSPVEQRYKELLALRESIPEETGGTAALRLRPHLHPLGKQLHLQRCHAQSAHHTLTDTILIPLTNCYRRWTFVHSNSDNYGNTISSDVDW